MLKVEEKTTLVGVSELRKVMTDVLEEIKTNRVVLTRRNRPVGIIIDYKEFNKMEETIEALEDQVLGQLAGHRASRKSMKSLTLEQAEKKVGLR